MFWLLYLMFIVYNVCLFNVGWVSVFSSVYNCCGECLHLNFIDRETQRLITNREPGDRDLLKQNISDTFPIAWVLSIVFTTQWTRQVPPSPTQAARKNVLIGRIPTPGPVSHKKCRLSLAQREPSQSIRRHAGHQHSPLHSAGNFSSEI